MPAQDDASSSGPSALEAAALPHAVRCWEAEVENARRLSTRVQVLLSLATALLGFLLMRGAPPGTEKAVSGGALSAALTLCAGPILFGALVLLLRPRPRNRARPLVSHWLAWPTGHGMDPGDMDARMAQYLAWNRLVRASDALRRANASKQVDVDRGQLMILGGAGCALTGHLLYWMGA